MGFRKVTLPTRTSWWSTMAVMVTWTTVAFGNGLQIGERRDPALSVIALKMLTVSVAISRPLSLTGMLSKLDSSTQILMY